MSTKKIHLIIAVLFAGVILFHGCRKSEPAPPAAPAATTQGHEGHEHAATTAEPAKEVVAAAEQTTCPIMGGAIDKNIFVEYKGKKVYFCCPGCEEQFKKEPEKYIAKLPQFQP
jgi:YHS domain-containing protein